jgi:hypothetical protein
MDWEINNLTEEQVEMLDIIWSFDTPEEYIAWHENLDEEEQRQAEMLQRLVILETMEEMMNGYADARDYLKKFQL